MFIVLRGTTFRAKAFGVSEDNNSSITTNFTEVVIMIIINYFSRFRQDSSVSSRARRFLSTPRPFKKDFFESWISRMYFATFPVSTLGNWIPRVLSQWYCSGHGCGFDQIVIENAQGKHLNISRLFCLQPFFDVSVTNACVHNYLYQGNKLHERVINQRHFLNRPTEFEVLTNRVRGTDRFFTIDFLGHRSTIHSYRREQKF